MNLLKFELKQIFVSIIAWTNSLLCVFLCFMLGVFPLFEENVSIVNDMLANIPESFGAAFGFDFSTFSSFNGFYNFGFCYFALIGAIMACSISIHVFAREKRNKCNEFLFAKPITKTAIFQNKLLCVVIALCLCNLIYIPASCIAFYQYDAFHIVAVLSSCSLLLTQIVFASIGIFISVFFRKIRSVASISTAVGFSAFFLSILANILEKDALLYISPLQFFEPKYIAQNEHYHLARSLWACIIVCACMFYSFIVYTKKEHNNT